VWAEGEVDEEWPRWFAKALRPRAIPGQFGPFYIYAGPAGGEMECVWTNTATSTEEVTNVDAQRASELAQYGTVAAALAARRAEVERMEQRAIMLQEQMTATEGRVARLQQQEELLERGLADERKRCSEEKASLAAEAKAARELASAERKLLFETTRAEKQQALDELSQVKKRLLEDLTSTMGHITGLSDGLMKLEVQTAENAMARRSLGNSHLHEHLTLLDNVAEAHRLGLGATPAETPGDRIANALAGSIESGKIVGIIQEISKAVRGKKKDDDDDDDDED